MITILRKDLAKSTKLFNFTADTVSKKGPVWKSNRNCS